MLVLDPIIQSIIIVPDYNYFLAIMNMKTVHATNMKQAN